VQRSHKSEASARRTDQGQPQRDLDVPVTGRRESKRRETRARIKAAALALFLEKGYENTTVREIAARADVGFGTLFSHAAEKRELLFLLFDDIVRDTFDRSFRKAAKTDLFADQLMAIFAPPYRMHAPNPKLGRALFTELTFTPNTTLRQRFPAFDRTALVGRIAEVVDRAKVSGQVMTTADSEFVARVIFSIFTGSLRAWLVGPCPVASAGIANLRSELELLVTGLASVSASQSGAAKIR
jgi:AcrR family transcriptional regulator